MMKRQIICFIGHDSIGKTTLSEKIQRLHSGSSVVMSLATPLKKMLHSIGVKVYEKPYSQATRITCRAYADVMMEQHGDRYWVNQLITRIDKAAESLIIVDDVRQVHEVDALSEKYNKDLLFIILKTNNNNKINPTEMDMFRSVREVDLAAERASNLDLIHNQSSAIIYDRDELSSLLDNAMYNQLPCDTISRIKQLRLSSI